MTMIRNLIRYSKRQLHTIVSKEIIKPSSPTPSHLKTYNLSLLDQVNVPTFIPVVTFYPNSTTYRSSPHEKTLDLKKSLSKTLAKYYPFAGRHAKDAPTYVDCNDNGAEFLEASVDRTLSDFLQNSKYDDLDEFFPYGLVNDKSNRGDEDLQSDKVIPLAVQVNHFECGGVAVAVSLSHKIADGSSIVHFISDWAKMTRLKDKSGVNPYFIPHQHKNLNFNGFWLDRSNCVTRSFTFPNSKINELKLKVKAMTEESGQPIKNPTRVEVLTWLIYKCAVSAATKNNSGTFKPTGVSHLANIRGRMIEPLPQNSIGNLFVIMNTLASNEDEMKPEFFISEFKKQKLQLQSIPNVETAFDIVSTIMCSKAALEEQQRILDRTYISTGLSGFPTYEIDFGWGKPVKVTMAGHMKKNCFILMDSPNGDGMEVLVSLGNQDMEVFQNDPELHAFF